MTLSYNRLLRGEDRASRRVVSRSRRSRDALSARDALDRTNLSLLASTVAAWHVNSVRRTDESGQQRTCWRKGRERGDGVGQSIARSYG